MVVTRTTMCMAPDTDANDDPVLPGIESFDEDYQPSDEMATVRFENGARFRARVDEDGQAHEEVFHPDDEDDPTVKNAAFNFGNAAQYLVDVLIEYEAYRPENKYNQLRGDWGREIAETLAGVTEKRN